jgi:hypothetical protein
MNDNDSMQMGLDEELRRSASGIESLEGQKAGLEDHVATLQTKLGQLQNDRLVRLGILGVRDSAKSSLLAAWYLFNADRKRGVLLKFKDDQSISYLRDIAQPILKTGSSKATPTGAPTTIRFDLIINGEEWRVETMDFTGNFVQLVSEAEEKKLAQPCRDFLRACDVIICCHYWNDRSQETLDAINRVFEKYKFQFLLALTRLDERGPLPTSKEEFEQILTSLQDGDLRFRNLVSHILDISRHSGTVYAVAVSPLGKDFSNRQNFPPGKDELTVEDLTPFGIYRPLELAVDRKRKKEGDVSAQRLKAQEELDKLNQLLSVSKNKHHTLRTRASQTRLEELVEVFNGIKEQIDHFLEGGTIQWATLPVDVWLMELDEVRAEATKLGNAQLVKYCVKYRSAIQKKSLKAGNLRRLFFEYGILLIVGVIVGVPLIWLVWLVMNQPK